MPDAKATVMIVGTYPQGYESKIGNALKDALLTTRWYVGGAPPDQFEGLSGAPRITRHEPIPAGGRQPRGAGLLIGRRQPRSKL